MGAGARPSIEQAVIWFASAIPVTIAIFWPAREQHPPTSTRSSHAADASTAPTTAWPDPSPHDRATDGPSGTAVAAPAGRGAAAN